MGIKDFFDEARKEGRALQGEETKDKFFSSHRDFESEQIAFQHFKLSKEKLFNVDAWSDLPGLSSTFELHTADGHRKKAQPPRPGDYIRIELPGPMPENWVQVTDVRSEEKLAEFTVNPSEDPTKQEPGKKIEHFFIKEASSTFRLEWQEKRIIASEIGKNEGINNQGEEAGGRSLINTLIAAGGWAFFQKVQWEKLTDYLVHKLD
jgi:hypothetical protein